MKAKHDPTARRVGTAGLVVLSGLLWTTVAFGYTATQSASSTANGWAATFTFSNLPPAAQSSVAITLTQRGDFDRLSEFTDFYADGANLGRFYGNRTCTNESKNYSVPASFIADGTLIVVADANPNVDCCCAITYTVTISYVSNTPPVAVPGGPYAGAEGAPIALNGSGSSDPDGTVTTWEWDCTDDGTYDMVATAATGSSCTYPDDGPYSLRLRVTDDSGGTHDAAGTLTVTNVAPVASVGPPPSGVEGSPMAFAGSVSDPGTADTHTFAWDFGDGTTTVGSATPSHAYADDGSYTVTLTVTDDDGAVDTASVVASPANVAPTITTTPPSPAVEGTPYLYQPAAVDPGADTQTWSLGAGGATWPTIDPATGAVTGTPPVGTAGTWWMAVVVDDGDGGADVQSHPVQIAFVDDDDDGLSDAWESSVGLDPTDPTDATSDVDGDGLDALAEFLGGTDPFVFDGPGAPVLLAPIAGDSVADARPPMSWSNALDPQNDTLTYDVEVYADANLAQLLEATAGVPEDPGGTTQVGVSAPLAENADVFWRARAADPYVSGPWTNLEQFFVTEVEEAPDVPTLLEPTDGQVVDVLEPTFVWSDFSDVDRDEGTFELSVEDVATGAVLVETTGPERSTTHVLADALAEDAEYLWRVRAIDETGLHSDWSEPFGFVVDTANGAPSAVTIVQPRDGDAVEGLSPTIVATGSIDPEGRAPAYRFELDRAETFDTEARLEAVLPADAETVAWVLGEDGIELTENVVWFARVRAEDEQGAASAFAGVSFFVRGANDAPAIPVLVAPDASASPQLGVPPTFVVGHVADPEGDLVLYRFARLAGGDQLDLIDQADVAPGSGPEGTADQTSWRPAGVVAGELWWSAQAIDSQGAASAWAPARRFLGHRTDPPGPVPPEDEGCGSCSHSQDAAGSTAASLAFLALLAARRRCRVKRGARAACPSWSGE